jgi:hypothetical protein
VTEATRSVQPIRRRRRPSSGFVIVCAVYAALAAFFVWGLSAPDLDRAWVLHHELKAGRVGAPSRDDIGVLTSAMARHDELARALLSEGEIGLISAHSEGWLTTTEATIVRTDKADARYLALEIATPAAHLPVAVDVEGQGWRKRLTIDSQGMHRIELPALPGQSELIVLRLAEGAPRDPSAIGVRVSFEKGGKS